ncbi:hypothetical protein N7532_009262 [Penicillium argentinense]|uniref:DUF7907 domain-containing protein n=1 Tax=Penicillium argentinense TaxID=1131581 RepID=A0A9W9EYY2_9EURO|nr:uncharacterized protein N7532_009262 [Penicillium argentinense]KAJ5090578.1 hypothetical protein N7532_009262 [Penicillium argentinense]
MKFVTNLALLATATSVAAGPVQKIFNIVTSGATDDSNNGLYLSTQRVDPLNSNAVFRAQEDAADFYVVNDTIRYDAPNKAPYAIALVSGSEPQGDVEISVSPTTGSEGFSLTSEKKVKTSQQNFGGWLVCDGENGVQALYYENTSAGDIVPDGCDSVQLDAVFKSS